ncbi:MAG TPA: hypothetical protein DD379_10650 [Cyanobacteria bacterium UBA11162]|nr:hypothetical protein [Cyanobacteria bacterium UBA11162]
MPIHWSIPKAFLTIVTYVLLATPTQAKEYQVYFLGGQSNMEGYGYIRDLPEELNKPLKGVMIYQGNSAADGATIDGRGIWAELKPGHGTGFRSNDQTNFYSNRFGVELSFAQRLLALEPNSNIAIIKYSRGGTSLDSAAAGKFGSWEPDYNNGNGINQYDHFLATVKNAMSVDDIDGDGESDVLVPAGIVWMQGESDAAYTLEIAERYEANLKRLMDLLRAAFRTDDLPVVIGQISDSGQDEDGKVWTYGEVVRNAQAEFVQKDGYAALVTVTDNYSYSDPWHYNSEGYLDLGERFAEEIVRLNP